MKKKASRNEIAHFREMKSSKFCKMMPKYVWKRHYIYFENVITFREPSFIKMKTYQKITFNLSMWYEMKYVEKSAFQKPSNRSFTCLKDFSGKWFNAKKLNFKVGYNALF